MRRIDEEDGFVAVDVNAATPADELADKCSQLGLPEIEVEATQPSVTYTFVRKPQATARLRGHT
jgi:hypothetical protein